MRRILPASTVALMLSIPFAIGCHARPLEPAQTDSLLDARVKDFLNGHDRQWHDMNVPAEDGQVLHDLIVENRYTSALEVGTSTGHSTIWIAWALSKTGGKVVTVEIDEGRHRQALAHIEEAGLSAFVDARLADAHELVPQLEGPFDFVFQDADKDWYTRYFQDIYPKLEVGGCYVAHNVSRRGRGGAGRFLEYVLGVPGMETEVAGGGWSGGMSVSFKRADGGEP